MGVIATIHVERSLDYSFGKNLVCQRLGKARDVQDRNMYVDWDVLVASFADLGFLGIGKFVERSSKALSNADAILSV